MTSARSSPDASRRPGVAPAHPAAGTDTSRSARAGSATPDGRGWFDHVRRAAARGYAVRQEPGPVTWLRPDGSAHPDDPAADARLAGRTVAVVLPTTVRRTTPERFARWVEDVVAQLREVTATGAGRDRGLVLVVLQHTADEADEAARRARVVGTDDADVAVVAALTRVHGKVHAIGAAARLLAGRCPVVGWTDDDVRLEPGCLAALAADLRAHPGPAAVGARKVPGTSGHTTSRVLARAKELMPAATNYPHGCCMLVTADVLGDGIPPRYTCDDGWVCVRLLEPDAPDPFARLRLVPAAVCHYTVGGAAGSTWRRLRRQRVSQVVHVADADAATARCFTHRALLHGVRLRPRLRGGDPPRDELLRALVSAVHVTTTLAVVAELAVRGVVHRPLRAVDWGTDPEAAR